MTARDDMNPSPPEFDRLMTAWFETEARVAEPPELLERTIAQRRTTRPRPAWLLPERWYPMELTMRRARVPRAASYLILLVVVALLATAALILVGSGRRVPAPFGPAANGAVVYATASGDIVSVDPAAGVTKTVIGGTETDRAPAYSRDGLRIAFIRKVTNGDAIFVADTSGDHLVRITPDPMAEIPAVNWSPDGTGIAFVSLDRLWIARTDGSGAGRVDLGGINAIVDLAWRPPDGRTLLVVGTQAGKNRLFTVRPDGTGLQRVSPFDGGADDFQWVSPSPDGSRVAFGAYPAKQVHVVAIDEARDEIVVPDDAIGLNFPRWSPDGTRLAVLQVPDGDKPQTRIAVIAADDLSPHLTLTGPTFTGGVQFDWSPDGRSILANAWGTDETWQLDPAGGEGTRASWRAALDWVQWQRLAP